MTSRQFQRWVIAFGVFAVFTIIRTAPAAAQVRSGVEGRVLDESGALLPGVTVTISSPALQLQQLTTATDVDGRYRFTDLPVGVYRVVFELAGFGTVTRTDLQVGLGTIVTVDTKLGVGGLTETVMVTGQSPVVDVRTTTATTNLSKDLIAAVPTSRGVSELIKLAPGMRGTANYGVVGTISHTYDGIQARDTFRYPDVGSLEEVQVRAVGNDAEVATAGVNFIAAIKSGGNDFHGAYLGQWEGKWSSSNNIDDRLRSQGITEGNPKLMYRDASADLGGRLIRDRLWFYAAVRQTASRTKIIGYKGDPGPDGAYFTADDVEGNSDSSMTVRPTSKATLQLSPKQRINGVYAWEQQRSLARGAGAFTPHEATGNYFLPNDVKKVEWSYNPTNRSIVNAFVADTQWNSLSLPFSDNPPGFDNITRRLSGAYVNSVGSDSTPAGSNSERWIYNANYTYYFPKFLGGDHDFKMGFEMTREWYDKFQRARGPGTGGTNNDFRLYTESGAPFEVLLYNSPFVSKNDLNTQSAFVRDNWLLGDRLTVSLGLRLERYDLFLPDQTKDAGPYSAAQSFAGTAIYDWRNPAPRTAISYALTADKKTVLKATFGRFNDVPAAADGRTFNQNDYYAWRYKWTDLNKNGTYDRGEEGALVATESAQGAGLKVLNTDLRQPKEYEVTTHVERELVAGFATRVGYVYKRLTDRSQETNPARPFGAYNIPITALDPGADGKAGTADDGGTITYYDYDPATKGAAFDQAKIANTDGYTDRYHNLEFTATKRMSHRWQMLASYLITRKDLWRAGIPQTPNALFPEAKYWEGSGKLSGSFILPFDVQASAYYQYLSGAPWGRTARFTAGLKQLSSVTLPMESPEANTLPSQNTLDMRFEKRTRVGKGDLHWGFEMYNLFNSNTTLVQQTLAGPTFGQITSIAAPRNTRLIARYRF